MELLSILGFVALIGVIIAAMFLPRRSTETFSSDEMNAFRHAEQVKKDLGEVQGMVGPAKAPYTISVGGSYLPAPAKKPDPPPT